MLFIFFVLLTALLTLFILVTDVVGEEMIRSVFEREELADRIFSFLTLLLARLYCIL